MLRRTLLVVPLAMTLLAGSACSPGAARPRPATPTSPATTGQAPPSVPGSEGTRPNVLLIVTDDQRADTLEAMPKTLRWLAEGGVRFPEATTPVPLCCPARASIFTGSYMHNHHVETNEEENGWGGFARDRSLQHYLAASGYRTGLVGKYFNRWPIAEAPPDFERYSVFSPGNFGDAGYLGTRWNVDGEIVTVPAYSTTFVRRQSIDLIEGWELRDGMPWFLYVAPFAPHGPSIPEPRYADAPVSSFDATPAVRERNRDDKPPYVRRAKRWTLEEAISARARHLRSLRSVDDMVDALMRRLRSSGELDRTLVFFLSDNAILWFEHGLALKGYPYLQDVRIPFLARLPGLARPGTVDRRAVSSVDVAPTVMEAVGLRPTAAMDGRSLLHPWDRDVRLIEYTRARSAPSPSWAAMLSRREMYVEYYGEDGEVTFREYYDLRADPWQLRNLLRDEDQSNDPDVDALETELADLRTCVGTTCP